MNELNLSFLPPAARKQFSQNTNVDEVTPERFLAKLKNTGDNASTQASVGGSPGPIHHAGNAAGQRNGSQPEDNPFANIDSITSLVALYKDQFNAIVKRLKDTLDDSCADNPPKLDEIDICNFGEHQGDFEILVQSLENDILYFPDSIGVQVRNGRSISSQTAEIAAALAVLVMRTVLNCPGQTLNGILEQLEQDGQPLTFNVGEEAYNIPTQHIRMVISFIENQQ